jgi:hypothetical protein
MCNKCVRLYTRTAEECTERMSRICTSWIWCSGMEAAFTSETSVMIYQTTRRHIPEDSSLRSPCLEDLWSRFLTLLKYILDSLPSFESMGQVSWSCIVSDFCSGSTLFKFQLGHWLSRSDFVVLSDLQCKWRGKPYNGSRPLPLTFVLITHHHSTSHSKVVIKRALK